MYPDRIVVIEPESVRNVVTSNPAKSQKSTIERFSGNITYVVNYPDWFGMLLTVIVWKCLGTSN